MSLLATLTAVAWTQTADASIVNCSGVGVTPSNVMYGVCRTDSNGGSGSVDFSNSGLTAHLAMKSQRSAQEIAGFWQSNGPVNSASSICVTVDVTHLRIHGDGSMQHSLGISYNNAPRSLQTWPVDSLGSRQYCGSVPPDATNIWWQLLTLGGGPKTSRAEVMETITDVVLS